MTHKDKSNSIFHSVKETTSGRMHPASVSSSNTHTHTHVHTRTRTHTHAHARDEIMKSGPIEFAVFWV